MRDIVVLGFTIYWEMLLWSCLFHDDVVIYILMNVPDGIAKMFLTKRRKPLTGEECHACSYDVLRWAVKETYAQRFAYLKIEADPLRNRVTVRGTGVSARFYAGMLTDFTSE
jgi:hypothetical protein